MSQFHTPQEIIAIIAQYVRDSSDLPTIANKTLNVIHDYLHSIVTCIHILDDKQQSYHLLQARLSFDNDDFLKTIQTIPYHRSPLFNHSDQQQQLFLIEDIQDSKYAEHIFNMHPLPGEQIRGVVSVPLWFGNCCEGILTAAFSEVLPQDDATIALLPALGTYIAAALSQTRLSRVVQFEQTRLYRIIDQLPEGVLISDSVTGSIYYANNAAARLLQIPLSQLVGSPVHQFIRHPTAPEKKNARDALPPWNFFSFKHYPAKR